MSLAFGRALAGVKAFTGVRPRQQKLASNGSKVFMRRKDSYMVEVGHQRPQPSATLSLFWLEPLAARRQVNLDEDESEDIAVRRFMRAVMDSKVIQQVRACGRCEVRKRTKSFALRTAAGEEDQGDQD